MRPLRSPSSKSVAIDDFRQQRSHRYSPQESNSGINAARAFFFSERDGSRKTAFTDFCSLFRSTEDGSFVLSLGIDLHVRIFSAVGFQYSFRPNRTGMACGVCRFIFSISRSRAWLLFSFFFVERGIGLPHCPQSPKQTKQNTHPLKHKHKNIQ